MQGATRSQYGALLRCFSQRQTSKSPQRVAPIEFNARRRDILEKKLLDTLVCSLLRLQNHMDQNEKLQCHGCTHVVMIDDGCSQVASGFGMMEINNPIDTYDEIFRVDIAKYDILNQLRIDHFKEFVLTIFV